VAEEQVHQAPDEQADLKTEKARERAAQEKKERMHKALRELEKIRKTKSGNEKKEARVSTTDPEARIMKQQVDGGYAPAYNLQLTTDAHAGIIVGVGISQDAGDFDALLPAVERLGQTLGAAPAQIVVDGGYTTRENIVAMAERETDLIGHFRSVSHRGQFEKRGVDAAFWPEHFFYDELHDTYTCPEGKTLPHQRARQPVGKTNHIYQARREDCASCPHKQKCCPGDHVKRRWIVRSVYDPAVVSFIEKMKTEEAKAIYKQRGAIAEFPNAWIKEKIGLRQFRLRGLVKVGVEALWACLTYNIQQWIRLCWRPRLAKAEM
jgi:Transposase DDE domain